MCVQLAPRQLFARHSHQTGNRREHIAVRPDINVLGGELVRAAQAAGGAAGTS